MHTSDLPVLAVLTELREEDLEQAHCTEEFAKNGCRCSTGPGGTPCCRQFPVEHYRNMRDWCAELTKEQREMVLKGQIMAMTSTTATTTYRHQPHQRQREHTTYRHQGLEICRTTFLFLHNTGLSTFKAIRRSCREDGLVPRVHGNTKKAPVHALSFEDTNHVVSFIRNYAEDHAIQLPGRIPGYKRSDLQLLPCSTTRRLVWLKYSTTASELTNIRTVTYISFCRIWRKFLPNILPTRPMTDLCAVCQRNAGLIQHSSNLSEAEKSQVLKKQVINVYVYLLCASLSMI